MLNQFWTVHLCVCVDCRYVRISVFTIYIRSYFPPFSSALYSAAGLLYLCVCVCDTYSYKHQYPKITVKNVVLIYWVSAACSSFDWKSTDHLTIQRRMCVQWQREREWNSCDVVMYSSNVRNWMCNIQRDGKAAPSPWFDDVFVHVFSECSVAETHQKQEQQPVMILHCIPFRKRCVNQQRIFVDLVVKGQMILSSNGICKTLFVNETGGNAWTAVCVIK